MSFGRAFDAFVGGLESGLKSGSDLQDRQLARRPAKEAADLNRNVTLQSGAPVQGLGQLQGRLQTNSGADEAIPTAPNDPDGTGAGYYAQGGYVDPVEQSNGDYYKQEAQRTAPREAVPTAPVSETPPTPPARPGGNTDTIPTDDKGNIIQQTVEAVKNMPPLQEAGAVPTGEPTQGPVHPIQTMVDPSGRSYPDLTQTIGGIRAVTGAPADRPLTTADHIDFLQRRVQYAAAHGYDMNEVLKFNVQYLDNLRFQASRTFALASAAWDAGDGQAVQKFVQQGYGMVPDGMGAKTSFNNGVLTVQPYDEKTGKAAGDPVKLTKDQFMQKAQSITGDPISWGRAIENVPYTAGTSAGAGRGRGRGRYRTSDAGDTTGDTGAPAAKPMSAAAQKLFDSKFTTQGDRAVATTLQGALPPGQNSTNHIERAIGIMKQTGEGPKDGPQGYGIYDQGGKLAYKVNKDAMPGAKPPNKIAEANPATPAGPAAPAQPQGLKPTKNGPPTQGGQPVAPAPGAAQAAPVPTPPRRPTEAIPTDDYPDEYRSTQTQPEGPGIIEQGRRAVSGAIKDKFGLNRPQTPSTAPDETTDNSGDALVRISEMEKKLADAKSRGTPEGSLRIMQAQIDRERAKLK